ncbi:MAG: DUF421 domain-containing protein [Oscillospiraceae bacterium]|nr:DUF421 domain-containing protein [Oscillospiraceae bacterium]
MIVSLMRTVILYLIVIGGVRLMGKRQVGELEPAELVLAMMISDLAAVPMQEYGIPLLYGVVPIVTLLCLTMLLSVATMRSVRLRALMCGKPSIVVQEGKLRQNEMRKVRMTIDELVEELRLQGVTDLTQVQYAILETNGDLSVLLKAEHQPVTAAALAHPPEQETLPLVLINDGRVLTDNLTALGLEERWLQKTLRAFGVQSPREVFLLSADRAGKLYFAAKEDAG